MKIALALFAAAAAATVSVASKTDFYATVQGVEIPRVRYVAEDDTNLVKELQPIRNDGRGLSKRDFHSLNLGLFLELLELTLFDDAFKKFSPKDWEKAGFGHVFRKLVGYMRDQEIGHAAAVQTILKGRGARPCKYKFPFHDVKSFVNLASQVTAVGEAAYLGFTYKLRDRPNILTSYQIFATEARQSATFRGAQRVNPLNQFFDTPLTESQAYTLAAPLVIDCPAENPKIPFTIFPSLKAKYVSHNLVKLTYDRKRDRWEDDGNWSEGSDGSDSWDSRDKSRHVRPRKKFCHPRYVGWINQVGVTFTPFDHRTGLTHVPPGQTGNTFLVLTDERSTFQNGRFVSDHAICAGPAFKPSVPGDFLDGPRR